MRTLSQAYPMVEVRRGTGVSDRVYIEGDGRAYITSSEASGDPTPINPVALKLFLADPDAHALFLGRPCQWVRTKVCMDRTIWGEKRFTQEMADLYVKVIGEELHGGPVELVGYSGGAWLALQVAARLPNVTSVRTVAGNVDPAEVNRIHGATPREVAAWPEPNRLRGVPQLHFVGSNDKVVTRAVADHYMAVVKPRCAKVEEVGASHGEGWESEWLRLLREPLGCGEGVAPTPQ